MERGFSFVSDREQRIDIGFDGERLLRGPGARLAVADEIRRQDAPVLHEGFDQGGPFLVRRRGAVPQNDARPFAFVEIGNLDIAGFQNVHEPSPVRILDD